MASLRTRRIGVALALATALAAVLSIAFWQAVARAAITGVAWTMGLHVSFGHLEVHRDRLVASDVHVENREHEPIADVGSLALRYSLRDLLPGGSRMFGLAGFDVRDAHVIVTRHPDGTLNVPLPQQPVAGGPPAVPYEFTGVVRNGSIDVYDRARNGSVRHLIVRNVFANLDIATNARSRYRAGLDYVEDGRTYPLRGSGDVSVADGFGIQRWRIARVPLGRIFDVALNSSTLHVPAGWLRDVDARIVALRSSDGSLAQHADITARLDGTQIAIAGISKPLRNVGGPIAAYGNGLLLQGLGATLAGIPVRIDGGVFSFASPQTRIAVTAQGDLGRLRAALTQTASLPLHGPARLDVTLEGAAAKPLVLIALRSPHITYGPYPIERARALVAFDGTEADVVDARARYGTIGMFAHGKLALHPQSRAVEALAGFDAPPGALPYAPSIAPIPLHATVAAVGDRPTRLDARGIAFGEAPGTRLAGVFDLRSDGVGTIGPLRFVAPHQSLYAVATVDRPHGAIDAFVNASNVRLASPRFAATVDANVAGSLKRNRVTLDGFADLRDVRTPAANVARAHVAFGRSATTPLVVAMDASGIGRPGGVATALVSYANGAVRVEDAVAATRGSFADARGNITGIQSGDPHYDLRANVHSVDVASLAAIADSRAGKLVEGSAEAHLHVFGQGTAPNVEGTLALPEGAVNGLAFHDFNTTVRGTPASLTLDGGSIGVGSTTLGFDAVAGPSAQRVRVASDRADLADFNDFFDAGDVLGGEGRIRACVALDGGALVSTSGAVTLHDAKLRTFDIGAVDASWQTRNDRIDTALAFGGPSGRVSASGSIGLAGDVDLLAHAREVDLAQWLPMAGIVVPVTGIAQADVAAAGRFPNLDSRVSARVTHGSAGRVPVSQFAFEATTTNGRGRLVSSTLVVPHARVDGTGTFGLREGDPLGLTFHATTPDVAALADTIGRGKLDAAGSLDSTLQVRGTRLHPRLYDAFTLNDARYGRLQLPHATGRIGADEQTVTIESAEIDLRKGRVRASGSVPVRLMPFQVDPHNRPVSATIVADDVEASNLVDLLPRGTNVGGRIDGRVSLSGSMRAPEFDGTMTLADGSFSGPQERVPITGANARLVLSGTSARLVNAHANAGGGTLDAGGVVSTADVYDLARSSAWLTVRAQNARIDLPAYIKGRVNADVQIAREVAGRPTVSGTVAIDRARIPMTALYDPKASGRTAVRPPDLGMNLQVVVGRDVRVVSPNVDVGTEGSVQVAGTLAKPQLTGVFTSTGGTVDFFRDFTVENATVTFDPSSGIVPDVDAAATTFITNPDTSVALRVSGPATHLNLDLASDPAYDRQQILGLLVNAQSLGAVQGVQTSGSSPFSTSSAISNLAAGQLNAIFTRNLLEPLSVAVGGNLGLQNLQITNDVQSGLGLNAVKAFGKDVNFVFADTFNEPRRESWSVQAHPSDRTQFELTAYSSQETSLLGYRPFLVQQLDMGSFATIPLDTGTNGVDLKLQRKFP